MSGGTTYGVDSFSSPRAWRRSRIHGRRVLYVDDDHLMGRAVSRVLRGAGAVCLGAQTHDQAIALLEREHPLDLAILDFQMPDGDPRGLLQRLRERWPSLPVVGASGLDRRSEFAARGVDRFLRKPWALDDLIVVADWSEAQDDRRAVLRR